MNPPFTQQIEISIATFRSLVTHAPAVERIAVMIRDTVLNGHTLFTCGNGGSAADSMHLAEELVGRYRSNRRALPAVALAADSTALTCIANDFGYEYVFARQIEALGRPNDLLVCLSTSGNSPSILEALRTAHATGMRTVALLGKGGGPARGLADAELIIESDDSARIQEAHMQVVHYVCEVIERQLQIAH